MNVTLILIAVGILGSGLLRQGRWDPQKRQRVLPPSQHARVHGLEATQTERRFDLVELDRFRYSTPARSPPSTTTSPACRPTSAC